MIYDRIMTCEQQIAFILLLVDVKHETSSYISKFRDHLENFTLSLQQIDSNDEYNTLYI